MSELTLFLIRIAFLAILWIFVLSAISVIRSDMFGARMPDGGRGAPGPLSAPGRRSTRENSAKTWGASNSRTQAAMSRLRASRASPSRRPSAMPGMAENSMLEG